MVDSFSIGCEFCGCSTCPGNYRVSKPSGIVAIEGLPTTTCIDLERQGLEGLTPPELCTDEIRLDPIFRSTCGCPETPSLLYGTGQPLNGDNEALVPTSSPVAFVLPGFLVPNSTTIRGSKNPIILVQENPIQIGCIVAGAIAVAGIYLMFQLRRTAAVVAKQTTKIKEVDATIEDEEEGVEVQADAQEFVDDDDGESQIDKCLDYMSTPSQRMIYILNDDDSVSEYGSVNSYNIQL